VKASVYRYFGALVVRREIVYYLDIVSVRKNAFARIWDAHICLLLLSSRTYRCKSGLLVGVVCVADRCAWERAGVGRASLLTGVFLTAQQAQWPIGRRQQVVMAGDQEGIERDGAKKQVQGCISMHASGGEKWKKVNMSHLHADEAVAALRAARSTPDRA
jgi:hypothetical protein